jgi:hypothetical protein
MTLNDVIWRLKYDVIKYWQYFITSYVWRHKILKIYDVISYIFVYTPTLSCQLYVPRTTIQCFIADGDHHIWPTTYHQCYKMCPGGVAQWTSHPPQRQQSEVRVPPGYEVFRKNQAMLLCVLDLIFIVCVFKEITKGIGPKIFLKVFVSRPQLHNHKYQFISHRVITVLRASYILKQW